MRPVPRKFRWIGLGLAVVAAVVVLAVVLSNLRAPQPLRYRLDPGAPGVALRTVTVYVLDPDSLRLEPREREVLAEGDTQRLVEELVGYLSQSSDSARAPLPGGTALLHYFDTGNGEAVLDFNEGLEEVAGSGIREERLKLSALTRTLAENVNGLERVRLLVRGRPLTRWGAHLEPPAVLELATW